MPAAKGGSTRIILGGGGGADSTPDAFAFTDETDATRATRYQSNAITVAGLGDGVAAPLSVLNGYYSKNGGADATALNTVVNGDTVRAVLTTSSDFNTALGVTVTIGGVADVYTVTTLVEDTTPTAFTLTDVTGAALATVYESNLVTVSGLTDGTVVAVTVAGGEYSKNGGAYTSAAGTVVNGDTLKVRVTSDSDADSAVAAVLTVGGVSDTYTVTTIGAGAEAPVEVASGISTAASYGSWVDLATAANNASSGDLIAFVDFGTQLQEFRDTTGAAWTLIQTATPYRTVAAYKRRVGSNPIVAGVTKFQFKEQFGSNVIFIKVFNVASGTGIPTTVDTVAGNQPGKENLPTGASTDFVAIPAPSAAGSYQFVAYTPYNCDGIMPDFGTDDSFVSLGKLNDSALYGSTANSIHFAWRKEGPTPSAHAIYFTPGQYSFQGMLWGEIAAPDTGESGATGGGGGGGGGGLVSSYAEMLGILAAGEGGTYTLADDTDFGYCTFANFNRVGDPVTFVGGSNTSFQAMKLQNCHGIHFEGIRVYGLTETGGNEAGVLLQSNTTDVSLTNMEFLAADFTPENPIGGGAIRVEYCNGTADSNIFITGQNSNAVLDVQGYAGAVHCLLSNGIYIEGLTFSDFLTDGILFYGCKNAYVKKTLARDSWSFYGTGDHPDFIQWAAYGGVDPENILIEDSGYQRVNPDSFPVQGIFGEDALNLVTRRCWTFGGMLNSASTSRGDGYTVDDCFFQGNAETGGAGGSRILARGGVANATLTDNYSGGALALPGEGPYPGLVVSGNTDIGNRELGDYTDLDPWLADHTASTRQRW